MQVGAVVQEDISEASVVFGVKQVPIDSLQSNKTFCFFSHTIKVHRDTETDPADGVANAARERGRHSLETGRHPAEGSVSVFLRPRATIWSCWTPV